MTQSKSDYVNAELSKLWEAKGCFFAFSREQLEEKLQPDTKYVRFTNLGLFIPKQHADEVVKRMDEITEEGIRLDKEHNTQKEIIWRELANHEAQISCDPTDTIEALQGYGYTTEEIEAEYRAYFNHCVDNDFF